MIVCRPRPAGERVDLRVSRSGSSARPDKERTAKELKQETELFVAWDLDSTASGVYCTEYDGIRVASASLLPSSPASATSVRILMKRSGQYAARDVPSQERVVSMAHSRWGPASSRRGPGARARCGWRGGDSLYFLCVKTMPLLKAGLD